MMKRLGLAVVLTSFPAPVFADGDVADGAAQFIRQCVACHVVRDDAGNILAGRVAKVGPNLYGIADRPVASDVRFRYGDSITLAGAAGVIWSQENFVTYVQDPTKWLRDALSDRRARSKMGYRVRSDQDAQNIFAYLASLAP
jgi:cytochrome c